MTSPIIDFIEARLAEDEAAAQAASKGPWEVDDLDYAESITDANGYAVVAGGRWGDEASVFTATEDAVHIARHDPARVLREVQAKRAILDDHQIKPAAWPDPDDQDFGCQRCHFDSDEGVYGFGYCPTLKALAAVYSDHESYRKEWAA